MASNTNKITTIIAMKDQTGAAIRSARGGMDGLTQSHKAMKLAAAAAFAAVAAGAVQAVRSMTRMTAQMATLGDDMDKLHRRTGLAVEDLSEWGFVMKRNGSSIEIYEKGVRQLARSMYEGQRGTKTYTDAFNGLGVAWADADGNLRNVNDVLLDMAERFAALESEEQKVALATALLGSRSGTQLLAALRGGRAEIEPLIELARELNVVMSTEFAAASAAFVDVKGDVEEAWKALKRSITFEFIKVGTPLMEGLGTALGELSKHIENNPDIFEDLAGDLAGAASGIITDAGKVKTALDEILDSYREFKQTLDDVQNHPVTKVVAGTIGAGLQMIPREAWGGLAYPEALTGLVENMNSPDNPINKYLAPLVAAPAGGASAPPAAATAGPLYTSPDSAVWANLARPPARPAAAAGAAAALPAVGPAPDPYANPQPAPDPAALYPELFVPGEGVDHGALMASLVDQDFGGWLENVVDGLEPVRTALDAMGDAGKRFAEGFAHDIGYSLADAAFYGADFGEAMVDTMRNTAAQAMAEVAAVIAKSALKSFLGLPLPFAQGGALRAAGGLVVGGQPGMDSVPALLMPGEAVVDRSTTRALADFLEVHGRAVSAGAPSADLGGGRPVQVVIQSDVPVNAAGQIRLARRVEQILDKHAPRQGGAGRL